VFELQPDLDWDKGAAVRWLLRTLSLDGPDVLPVYIGDDVTDEDAFPALAGEGLWFRGARCAAPDRGPLFAGRSPRVAGAAAETCRRDAGAVIRRRQ
jgi:hypothetical protein